jgi:hypothetical protein
MRWRAKSMTRSILAEGLKSQRLANRVARASRPFSSPDIDGRDAHPTFQTLPACDSCGLADSVGGRLSCL